MWFASGSCDGTPTMRGVYGATGRVSCRVARRSTLVPGGFNSRDDLGSGFRREDRVIGE